MRLKRLPSELAIQPDYMKLWLGQTLSLIGDSLGGMAVSVMLLQRTGSAMILSVGFIISWLPTVVLGPFAGVLIDRISRKTALIIADTARGLLTLIFAVALWHGHTQVVYAYLWQFGLAVFRTPYMPATQAIIPALVGSDRLQRANSLQSMGQSIAQVIGPALAGLVIAALGGPLAMALDAASFFISAGLITLTRPRGDVQMRRGKPQPALRQFREGLAFFAQNRTALALLAVAITANFVSQPSGIALQVHILKTHKASPQLLGLSYSASALVALLGSVMLLSRRQWSALGRMLLLSLAWSGTWLAAVAVPRNAALIPFVFAAGSFMGPAMQMSMSTLYQMIAPDEMRGRVFAVRQTFSTILSPVSMLAVGWAVDAVGTRPVFVALGAIAVIAAAVIACSPVARQSPHFGGRPGAAGTAA